MWLPAALAAFALAQDVARRSDYLDAYLERGPREVARYGYTYPMALAFLFATAELLSLPFARPTTFVFDAIPSIAPALFAAWLAGWRLVLQLLNVTLPIWGRAMGRRVDALADSLQGGAQP